jgi:hypothetical protein
VVVVHTVGRGVSTLVAKFVKILCKSVLSEYFCMLKKLCIVMSIAVHPHTIRFQPRRAPQPTELTNVDIVIVDVASEVDLTVGMNFTLR